MIFPVAVQQPYLQHSGIIKILRHEKGGKRRKQKIKPGGNPAI